MVSTGSASYTYVKSHSFSADDRRYDDAPYQSQDITPTSGAGPNRQNSVRAVASSVSGASGASAGAASIRIANLDLALPDNALFRINAGPAQRFLVQTDPQFVGTRSWLSSDFMLNQLGLSAGVRQLGDGFYEQQLIQRQVQQITGQRYLAGYSSNEAQYQALMNAGVQVAQSQRYTLGVALTEAQVAELKTDIVWLVKQTVTLADGSTQEVLVPQVYIHASNVQVTGQGTLIAGNDVAFQAAQDIVNSGGTIAGRQSVSLAGNNVQNLGGRISGSAVTVAAAQDINNLGGAIDARNTLVASAGRDINSASTTVATANAVTSGTNINQNASMSVSEANGSLTAVAGRDINLKASSTSANNVTLVAQRDVNLSTVHETSQEKITWDSNNRAEVNRDNAIGSTIQGKEISVTASRDINAQAAYVNAEGSLAATAGNNVNIGTDVSTASARDQHKKTDSGGMLASRTVSTDDSSSEAVNQGTTFSGNTVAVRAGNDINVKGSNVVSTLGTGMAAGNDVNIIAAVDSSTKNNFRQETTSGVMGAGFGGTIGTREQSHDGKTQGQTASASTVGSTDGNVSIVAGNRYTQVGSDVMAPKGDIDIAAKSVEIRAAEQASKTTTEDKFKQSGLTVAVTSPVISAIQTVDQMADAASKTKDGRMQALAVANMGFAAKNAGDAIKAGQGSTIDGKANQIATGPTDPTTGKTPSRDANDADKAGGINLALSVGSSSSESRSEQTSNTVRGSSVTAGGSINISAQGGGADSNIVIQGSDIKAGVNATLKAANEVRLLAAQNTSEQHSSNQSSSGSIGVSIGTDGLMFNASASGSRGRGDGSDVTQVNTHVDAGNKLTISSGTDTTLSGAVVSGKQVVMDVGTSGHGDLKIASLQDTSTYKSNQQSLGGSISVGMGKMSGSISASRSSVNGNYASVNEQSGIRAGDGGFQINVAGNTDLVGAKIASTDKAAAEGKNSLKTETLTQSDIQNRSDYKAESQSVSVGGGFSGGKSSMNGTGIGFGTSSGSESSTTRSGISQADITITDDKAQQAKTGKTAEQTIASINTDVSSDRDTSGKLTKQWDAQALQADVQAQAQITELFGKNAAKEIGSYATTKVNELNAKIEVAQSEDEKAALIAERDNWSEGGLYRSALHTAAGLLGGGVGGAIGAATSSVAMPQLAKLIDNTSLPLPIRQAMAQAAAAALGGLAGGASGLAAGIHVEANNRQLHESESEKLSALKNGKTPEEQQRLNAAACALVRCADGVPPSDPYYSLLKGLQDKGATYQNELETLRKTGEFVYIPRFDDISDFITRNSEYRQRAKGLSDLVAGTIGMVGGGGLAVGGLALCGPSAGASCATIPLGAFIAKTSNDQAQEGNQALFGAYRSTEGQRVIASFDIETYPGERIPLEEIGVEAGKRALIQVLGKYLPQGLMNVEEGALKRVSAGTTKSVSRTAEEIDAIEQLASRNGATRIVDVPAGTKGNWEPSINTGTSGQLAPKTAYLLDNGHSYITDASGRVTKVEGSLSLNTMDRNGYQQLCAGKSGCAGDDGGHLIASSLGGAGDRINIVPQASTLNRGDWKSMENYLKDELKSGKDISVQISVGYPSGGGVRPDTFTVLAKIGNEFKRFDFRQ